MKQVLAVLAGLVVGVLVIFLAQAIEMAIFPPPANFDPNDPEQVKQLMQNASTLSLVLVLVGYFLGAFIGGLVATNIIKGTTWMPALLVGTVLTVLGLINLLAIPHPLWFTIFGLVIYFAGSFISFLVYTKFKKNDQKS
jgi:MFS family permease